MSDRFLKGLFYATQGFCLVFLSHIVVEWKRGYDPNETLLSNLLFNPTGLPSIDYIKLCMWAAILGFAIGFLVYKKPTATDEELLAARRKQAVKNNYTLKIWVIVRELGHGHTFEENGLVLNHVKVEDDWEYKTLYKISVNGEDVFRWRRLTLTHSRDRYGKRVEASFSERIEESKDIIESYIPGVWERQVDELYKRASEIEKKREAEKTVRERDDELKRFGL